MPEVRCYIVGLGPGDPDLLTLRGLEAIEKSRIILCTRQVRHLFTKYLKDKEWIEFPGMRWQILHQLEKDERLRQIPRILSQRLTAKRKIKNAVEQGRVTAVLLQGDPGFFSPMQWFIKNIKEEYLEVVPGVSSINAASAALKRSLISGPDTESVIITAPEAVGGIIPHQLREKRRDTVEELSRLRTNLVFFMALFQIGSLIARLRKQYPPQTPAAVVYKAGFRKGEKAVMGTLVDIEKKIEGDEECFMGLFIVGPCLKLDHKFLWERLQEKFDKLSL